jgi:hypothetical protein
MKHPPMSRNSLLILTDRPEVGPCPRRHPVKHRNAGVFRSLRDHSAAGEEIDEAWRGRGHERG